MTVGEIVQKLQNLETIQQLSPQETCDYQVYLAAMYWQSGNDVIKAEQEYNKIWKIIRDEVESDKQADKRASLTEEWVRYRKTQYVEKTMIEVIRSLKKKMQQFESEARNMY